MPGPGSGIPEHEFKSRSEAKRLAEQTGGVPCDVCGKRLAVTVAEQTGQMEYAPLVCQKCADELKGLGA